MLDMNRFLVKISARIVDMLNRLRTYPDPAGLDLAGRYGNVLLHQGNDIRLIICHGRASRLLGGERHFNSLIEPVFHGHSSGL